MTTNETLKNMMDTHWMPFTSNKDFKSKPRIIKRAKGVELWDENDNRLIDASSGLFCVALGHGRQEIATAVYEQLLEMDYCAPFQLAQTKSFELSQRVSKLLPDSLNRIFYTCSGSESVDTAMKIAVAYHRARGDHRRVRFVSRERAYHGVNIGGTALSGMKRNREVFDSLSLNILHLRHTWNAEETFVKGQPTKGRELAQDLVRFIDLVGGENIAAVFIEPIAGSTGCLVPPVGYLDDLREICSRHGILLVFDEVITGFGRTGKAFGAQSFGVTPDVITMAKALTNGSQPMGAVAVSDEIYDTVIKGQTGVGIELFHGYTYSGHPAACVAGIATMKIIEQENLIENAACLADYFADKLHEALAGLKIVKDIRSFGLMAGVDITSEPGQPGKAGIEMTKKMFANGVHVKFTGDTAILAPPLVSDKSVIDEICRSFKAGLAA